MKNLEVADATKTGMAGGDRHLCFSLGGEEYAIPLLSVREVIAMPEITSVPQTPSYFLGIMNLRGQVISVLDLRQKLGIKAAESQETAVIICDLSQFCMGIVVDAINRVLTPEEGKVSGRPDGHRGKNSECVTGVYRDNEGMILFLDIEKTLGLTDLGAVQTMVGRKDAA